MADDALNLLEELAEELQLTPTDCTRLNAWMLGFLSSQVDDDTWEEALCRARVDFRPSLRL